MAPNGNVPFTGSLLIVPLLILGVAVPTPGAIGGFHEAFRLGVTVFYGGAGVQFDGGTAANLAVGVKIEVRGILSADGTRLLATRIKFDD